MKIIVTLILLALSNTVFSQEQKATMYFLDGTELIGLAQIKKHKILFRQDQDDKKKRYDQDEVSHLKMMEGRNKGMYYYKTILGRKKVILVQAYFRGKVNLYREYREFTSPRNGANNMYSGSNSQTFVKYFINKDIEDSKIRDIGKANLYSEDFKKIAFVYFGDCSMVMMKIKEDFFGKYKIKRLVNMYNKECN